jgi:aryl-alcohol dehydrogenase-like predicted oxidoreductase
MLGHMDTRYIGSLEVSVVGLGCNTFGGFGTPIGADEVSGLVNAALDEGVTYFDTADIYGAGLSETLLGRSLGRRRDEVVIATKVGGRRSAGLQSMYGDVSDAHPKADNDGVPSGAGARAIEWGAEESLRRLGTDRIDLYQIHFPDPAVPIDETLGALDRLVQTGKVREIGCSNFTVEQLAEADEISQREGWARFVSVQNEMSLLRPRPLGDVIPACADLGLSFIPYSPLCNGLLSGKYRRGEAPGPDTRFGNLPEEMANRSLSERTFDRLDRMETFARDHGHSMLELAIAWLLAVPTVPSVIAGATRPQQVAANVRAASWKLSPAEQSEVLGLSRSAS